ncbi:hypothetical protein C5Y96_19490 [Blastopirellula marina]|uniref:Uncharacterized protein n=1 Tax=Blastopirellula marina TaxID=124 RepID=A0A2S8F474_9BACT|nr:hypothetical protein C5Y96_19490 [Blastopirellula marina]RCS46551.1 hypothetical protein DTL36_19520 [Bremerella cremea]
MRRNWMAALLLFCMLGTTGCSGCLQPAETLEEREARLKKEETKDDFEPPKLNVLPSDDRRTQLNRVKPGHWVNVSTLMKANNFDFRGELYASTVDSNNRPVPITDTDYYFTATRPLALPKGQERWSDLLFYPPLFDRNISQTRLFAADLRPVGGGRPVLVDRLATTRMHPQEYYMVVLASASDEYQFLEVTDVVRPLHPPLAQSETAPHYRLVLPKTIDRVSVPENSMAWTSIAYVFWDGIDPELLSLDQQQAMIDWLHFGGQLIISGPDSLDRLKLSFLADYLPADDGGSIELGQDRFQAWNDTFVKTERIYESNKWQDLRYEVDLRAGALRGSDLKLRPEGEFIPNTGDLVAERRVGRGRIAVTAFQIRSPDISRNWKNFDSFLNAVLLRREPRKFIKTDDEQAVNGWADSFGVNDPRLVTSLRFMSRDLANLMPAYQQRDANKISELTPEVNISEEEVPVVFQPETSGLNVDLVPDEPQADLQAEQNLAEKIRQTERDLNIDAFAGFGYDNQSGVGGWSDSGGISTAARACLRDAAGISIPNGNFVLRVTAGYLLVLVPLNWFVFWMLGRVEWAWIAAPVIAILGAVCVIKLAELDIGFARSRTEIAFLEAHAGYHRAHLTRFTSLYTSLSTTYDMTFSESTAVALPFGRGADAFSTQSRRFGDGTSEVRYHQEGGDIQLSGVQVASNSSTMIHSEYFLSTSIQPMFAWNTDTAGAGTLTYASPQTLHDVGIVRRNAQSNQIEVAWLGDLEPESKQEVRFGQADDQWLLFDEWTQSPVLSLAPTEGEVNLRHMLNAVKDVRQLKKGETRLIGWTEEDMPGMTITPAANQRTIRTMVVAHLQHAALPTPKPDANTRRFLGQEPAQIELMELDAVDAL